MLCPDIPSVFPLPIRKTGAVCLRRLRRDAGTHRRCSTSTCVSTEFWQYSFSWRQLQIEWRDSFPWSFSFLNASNTLVAIFFVFVDPPLRRLWLTLPDSLNFAVPLAIALSLTGGRSQWLRLKPSTIRPHVVLPANLSIRTQSVQDKTKRIQISRIQTYESPCTCLYTVQPLRMCPFKHHSSSELCSFLFIASKLNNAYHTSACFSFQQPIAAEESISALTDNPDNQILI